MNLIRYRDIDEAKLFIKYISSIREKNNFIILYNEFIDNLSISKGIYETYNNYIGSLYHVIKSLLKNSSLTDYKEKEITLLTLSVFLILLKEEQTIIDSEKISKDELETEIKSILEELKLIGIGNGIVKSCSEILKVIFDLVKKVKGFKIEDIINSDINNYLKNFIEKQSINLENFNSNFDRIAQAMKKFNKL